MKKSFSIKSIDFYAAGVTFILLFCYFIGLYISGRYTDLNHFDSVLAMDTAQIARNTIRGDFFVTNYILPVGYAYFPNVTHHPDFIRYPLNILVYALIFKVLSPAPLYIKLFNSFLFLFNGLLIYYLTLQIQNENLINNDKFKETTKKLIASFTAVGSSIFFYNYFNMALSDSYEVLAFSLLLIVLNIVSSRKISPILYGIFCGLLYLAKPTFLFFVVVFTLYYLYPKKNFKEWFFGGLLCVLGFMIIVSPFIIRSYVITGEPTFALQHKVDSIKGVVYSHNELYKSFKIPPSLLSTITENSQKYFQRWWNGISSAIINLFSLKYILAWVGILVSLLFLKPTRRFIVSYLIFVLIHLIIVANYVEIKDISRVYSPLIGILFVFGLSSLFQSIFLLLQRKNIRFNNVAIILCAVPLTILISSILDTQYLTLKRDSQATYDLPSSVKTKVAQINPTCIYSNSPYRSTWYLNIPTVYSPFTLEQITEYGPKDCKYYLMQGEVRDDHSFFSQNASLIFDEDGYKIYQLK